MAPLVAFVDWVLVCFLGACILWHSAKLPWQWAAHRGRLVYKLGLVFDAHLSNMQPALRQISMPATSVLVHTVLGCASNALAIAELLRWDVGSLFGSRAMLLVNSSNMILLVLPNRRRLVDLTVSAALMVNWTAALVVVWTSTWYHVSQDRWVLRFLYVFLNVPVALPELYRLLRLAHDRQREEEQQAAAA